MGHKGDERRDMAIRRIGKGPLCLAMGLPNVYLEFMRLGRTSLTARH